MPDPLDQIFEESEIAGEVPPLCPRKKRWPGGLLNILSGIVVVGLPFTITINKQHHRLSPLIPTKTPGLAIVAAPSTTPTPGLPPTWTPTDSPTDTPTLAPSSTNTPISIFENSLTPTAGLEIGDTTATQDGSPASEVVMTHTDPGCNTQGVTDQFFPRDSLPLSSEVVPVLNQTQVASTSSGPFPTEQFQIKDLPPADGISHLFTPEIQYWEEEILAWSEEFGLDPDLIATVMQIESCGYIRAKSAAGAMGLFQVMPQHFMKNENPYDPDINAYRGLSWLRKTLIGGGSYSMALAGYNAGLARATNPYLEWPAETQRYVDWGLSIYQAARYDYEYSSALYDWLSKGGSALCNRATAEQQE